MEKNCPVCLSVKVRQEPFYYLFDNRKWCLYRCKKCSHQFILPFFKREEQIKIYNDFYFSSNGDWACGIYKKGYIESEVELRKEAKEILEMFPINKGKLLEIGCAGGFFLDEARKKGFIVEGIEPNPRMSSYAKDILGIPIINKWIEDVKENELYSNYYDIIVLLDVLEHIPYPYYVMNKIKLWLKNKGFIFIRGPIQNSIIVVIKEYVRRIFMKNKKLRGYPLDVNWFNKKSMNYLLNNFGITIINWVTLTNNFCNLLAQKNE